MWRIKEKSYQKASFFDLSNSTARGIVKFSVAGLKILDIESLWVDTIYVIFNSALEDQKHQDQ